MSPLSQVIHEFYLSHTRKGGFCNKKFPRTEKGRGISLIFAVFQDHKAPINFNIFKGH